MALIIGRPELAQVELLATGVAPTSAITWPPSLVLYSIRPNRAFVPTCWMIPVGSAVGTIVMLKETDLLPLLVHVVPDDELRFLITNVPVLLSNLHDPVYGVTESAA